MEPTPNWATASIQIRSVLRAQHDAWNRGDIDGFMNGYARSKSTTFVSEAIVRRGWETVLESGAFQKAYPEIKVTWVGGRAGEWLGPWMERIGGAVLIGIGLKIIADHLHLLG